MSLIESLSSETQASSEPGPVTLADLHCQILALAVSAPGNGTVRRRLLKAATDTADWAGDDTAERTAAALAVVNAATLRAFYETHARQIMEAGRPFVCSCLFWAATELEDAEAAAEAISE
ncbi:hypothetical protein [Salipiger marinus]|uniref:Uncharacterized protein n=1 Tax=Salipiger marinus TaxID=555512 RepID=A0A1G8PVN3_9RHOB|nr:hypothetical protein [Salipiger marinus]SDI96275.1 hypothetical protein SAMN04487993_1013134 [Salipiger marinus]